MTDTSTDAAPTTTGHASRLADSIHASLAAAAIGDALGAPTEQRSKAEIRRLFGGRVEQFHRPPEDSPYAKGRSPAQITDDSSQMIRLAEAFIDGDGDITARAVADMVLEWSTDPQYFPHFAGPSTTRAIEALRAGADPDTNGAKGRETTMGTSNGGAMRVAPAGLFNPGNIDTAVRAAAITCRPSHSTSIAVSGAGAIAAAVAEALTDGSTILGIVRAALRGAELGEQLGAEQGREVAGASVAERMKVAVELASTSPDLDTAIDRISAVVGTGLHTAEAVPAAVGFFVAAAGDPWWTVVAAANAGDDSDTVACMAGSIAGAHAGLAAIPTDKYRQVIDANDLDLADLAERIAAVASRRPAAPAHTN